ncbi:predicted protein [Histoplasma capsulatum G186AR]|uniref:Uncharacterized protein n=1 Tax=Ajellomyces capsulatus (strain G186AR / H82 / ATCC MYA-2454 / RMSCC 2432) TaxID=447093 RepID=C0P186_AJECG|nr:uncharacterized protein HCBG_09166 [Histoplasma capsulatum G186AR]EEH02601.1 predicted protein [Histoplasma capsulatum G186AR]
MHTPRNDTLRQMYLSGGGINHPMGLGQALTGRNSPSKGPAFDRTCRAVLLERWLLFQTLVWWQDLNRHSHHVPTITAPVSSKESFPLHPWLSALVRPKWSVGIGSHFIHASKPALGALSGVMMASFLASKPPRCQRYRGREA